MLIYTACATCRRELTLTHDAVNNESHRATHDGCPPPPKSNVDALFDNFAALVAKIAAPDYKPRQHDELNLTALQAKIDEHDQAPPRLAESAAIYAAWGFPVFPLRPVGAPCRNNRGDKCAALCQCPKTPATKNGFQDATTDVERVRDYWGRVPNAGIGIATGHVFDVIDVDLPDGPASWRAMVTEPGAPDVHGIVSTASGGRHFLVIPTGLGNKAKIRPGIDYRGMGGYVVAPPTWLGDCGHKWSWVTKPSPQLTGKAA